jgi:hypothetical protein
MTNGNVSNTCSPVAPTQLGSRLKITVYSSKGYCIAFELEFPGETSPNALEIFGSFTLVLAAGRRLGCGSGFSKRSAVRQTTSMQLSMQRSCALTNIVPEPKLAVPKTKISVVAEED